MRVRIRKNQSSNIGCMLSYHSVCVCLCVGGGGGVHKDKGGKQERGEEGS